LAAAKTTATKAAAPKKKIGRPSKADLALQAKREKKAERERASAFLEEMPPVYKCTRCGKMAFEGKGNFFAVINNRAFEGNDNRASICCECTEKFFNEYIERYKDEKLALMLVCMHLGVFFSESLYDNMHEKETLEPEKEKFTIGKYLRQLSGPQYKKQTFLSYMLSILQKKQAFSTQEESRDRLEENWKAEDRRNKRMCIDEIGYDCFDDTVYSSADRKQMYNSLAQYLGMDGVSEDKHKRDAAVSIVKTSMQMEFVDRELNRESRNPDPDFSRIDKLITAKKQLSEVINKIAKDNAISASGSGKRGKSTVAVTAIMKEMIDNGVIEIKPNLTEVKMCEAFTSIAEISSKALVNEMNITGDEYAVMVGQQSDVIREQAEKIMQLEEEKRLLTIRVHDFEAKRKRKTVNPVTLDIGAAAREALEEEEVELEFEGLASLDGDIEC